VLPEQQSPCVPTSCRCHQPWKIGRAFPPSKSGYSPS
jgi:hypothetical protein